MEGTVVSHYRILERLGGGGMGVVYRAEDTRLKRTVALKFLPPELTLDEEARARFVQEAQAASALDHPNICTIYDVAATDGGDESPLFIAMACYDGETLKARLARGPLPVAEAVDIAVQIARGLDKAHQAGIVHRDIKPANVMITRDGLVKILDFGIAKLLDRTGPTRTGTTVGTVAYMAPEQIEGRATDHRVDLWALGVVLFEMLTGRPPFSGEREMAILRNILDENPPPPSRLRAEVPGSLDAVVTRALAKNPDLRYSSAQALINDLTPNLAMTATMLVPVHAAAPAPGRARAWRRGAVAAVVLLLLAAIGVIGSLVQRTTRERRVETLLDEALRLAESDENLSALARLEELERLAPDDERVAPLVERVSQTRDITTDPEGADVSIQPFDDRAAPWRRLGQTPIAGVRLARGVFRWKVERAGYDTMEVLGSSTRNFPPMVQAGSHPEGTVFVPRGPLNLQLAGYDYTAQVPGGAYLIDKLEVTNRQYKAFIDAGGYTRRHLWADEFVKDGRSITWDEAMAEFRDRTGRPGPSTWEVGTYPPGQDEYPVGGVSWYEADAFARYAGRSLPTVYHWVRAAGTVSAAYITPLSNLDGAGPIAVGGSGGLSPSGALDMAGNVKEWCLNAIDGRHERYLLGGSWRDPSYMFTFADARSPFDRSEDNGFRLATYLETPLDPVLTNAVRVSRRDFDAERAVSDDVFAAYRSLFNYDPQPLDARVESRHEDDERWILERVSFQAAYVGERVPALVFLPKGVPPPYQAVVFAPGATAITAGSTANALPAGQQYEYLSVSGRAVIFPIYQGTYERNTGQTSPWPQTTRAYRDWIVQVVNDMRRAVDYLESRNDIRRNQLAFVSTSWGSTVAPFMLAQEARFKAAVLLDAGISQETRRPPELNLIDYLPRVTLPTLMVSGDSDFIFPVNPSQVVFFSRLGVMPDRKRHVILPGGHAILGQQRSQVIREVLDWLDRYVGPVGE